MLYFTLFRIVLYYQAILISSSVIIEITEVHFEDQGSAKKSGVLNLQI
jgi:hypothetical protein